LDDVRDPVVLWEKRECVSGVWLGCAFLLERSIAPTRREPAGVVQNPVARAIPGGEPGTI
ncbi:MAG TPA: hypothetical protein PK384_14220, partial [Candidatus Latescibacteria bacterium]|nr:hypothetical protein [Candidatus Latescibacterota bacterium]